MEGAPKRLAVVAFIASLLPLMALATLQNGLPVMAPALMQAAGMRPETFGWVGGAMGLGSVWLYMANAAFTTSLGPLRATQVAAAIAVIGVLLVLTGWFPLMLLGGLLVGFGYATMTPAGTQILADHTPRARRSTLFSIRQAGMPAGGAIAGLVGSTLVLAFGWRVALGGLALLVALVVPCLALAPSALNGPAERRSRFRLSRLVDPTNLGAPFRCIAGSPELRRLSAACIGFAVVQGTVNTFLVTYVTAGLGLTLTLAGALFATMQTSSVIGRMFLGFVADYMGSPRPVLQCLSVMSAASVLLLATLGADWSSWQLYAALAFTGMSISTWNGLYLAEVANLAPDNVSEATASTTFFVFATYMVTPPIMALIITLAGYRAAFALAAAGALCAGLLLTIRWPKRALPDHS
ncbi:MAG: MFS transporter [Hyphomicrobiaceae bacterium]